MKLLWFLPDAWPFIDPGWRGAAAFCVRCALGPIRFTKLDQSDVSTTGEIPETPQSGFRTEESSSMRGEMCSQVKGSPVYNIQKISATVLVSEILECYWLLKLHPHWKWWDNKNQSFSKITAGKGNKVAPKKPTFPSFQVCDWSNYKWGWHTPLIDIWPGSKYIRRLPRQLEPGNSVSDWGMCVCVRHPHRFWVQLVN